MIYIITPCSRPGNLPLMADSIPTECSWVISFDASVHEHFYPNAINFYCPETGASGNHARNFALDSLKLEDDDWVYILDDDNIVHPRWYEVIKQHMHLDVPMLTWGQVHKDGNPRLRPTGDPRVGNIDTACYMVRGYVMRNTRFPLEYTADGMLAEQIARNLGVHTINDYLAYYNYLR